MTEPASEPAASTVALDGYDEPRSSAVGEPEHSASGSPSSAQELTVRDEPKSFNEVIDSYVRDPTIDVDKLERLIAMAERREAREAELAFNAAKGRIKFALRDVRITKTKAGPDNAYRYAPLDEIDRFVAPLLVAESMDLSFTDEPMQGGGILVRGRLKHLPGGHYEDSTMPLPLDNTNKMKSPVQAMGSSNSFGRRYVTANIFNIVVVGDDDDGSGGVIDKDQAETIRGLIKASGADEARFLKYMKVSTVPEIAFRDYRKAIHSLEEKILSAAKEKANAIP